MADSLAQTLPLADDHAVTLVRGPGSDGGQVDPARAPLAEAAGEGRYAVRATLGEGGMGEVRLCRDRRIGRDVALKVIRPGAGSQSDLRARFEREARVQGQLEHPSIVPVYDLGVDEGGAAFFTMKRLRGKTLEEILGDGDELARFGTRKLLAAFAQVCQAMAFAHARGVLHRDLKPSNVMLGDYGEVWVLDWGLAKLIGDAAIDDVPDSARNASLDTDTTMEAPLAALPGGTAHGAVMGTPGYMAPEQVRGETDLIDGRTDVYALGAILFEILTLEPLHDRRKPSHGVLLDTLQGVESRPSLRAPDRSVAPELDAIVLRATALEPDERFASARSLLEELERFLDGDRDVQKRRELAAVHGERAREAAVRAANETGEAARAARSDAMREVNRALALDPSHADALAIMLSLLLDVPKDVPREAEEEFTASQKRGRMQSERTGAWAYLAWFVVTPIFLHMGIRSWPSLFAFSGAIVVSFVIAFLVGRGKVDEMRGGLAAFAFSLFAVGGTSMIFGPFVLVSAMAATNVVFFVLNVERGPQRTALIGASTLTVLLPLLLEKVGVLAPSYVFANDTITILPRMSGFPPMATMGFLLVANLTLILVPAILAARLHDGMRAAERRVFLHLWHLRQFLPDEARGATQVPVLDVTGESCVTDALTRRREWLGR